MARKTKRAKLIEDYAIKVQSLETEKEKKELLDKLNADLEAIGEPKMLELTEVERIAKKNREDAEECVPGSGTSANPNAVLNDEGVDVQDRPDFATTIQEQTALGVTWCVQYNNLGKVASIWLKQ